MFGQTQPGPISSAGYSINQQAAATAPAELGIASRIKGLLVAVSETEGLSYSLSQALGISNTPDSSTGKEPSTMAELIGSLEYRLQVANSRISQLVQHLNS